MSRWGRPVVIWFATTFIKAVYYSVTISLGIDSGPTALVFTSIGVFSAAAAHVALVPAALVTERSLELMGAINGMRYHQDSSGNIRIGSADVIREAEWCGVPYSFGIVRALKRLLALCFDVC